MNLYQQPVEINLPHKMGGNSLAHNRRLQPTQSQTSTNKVNTQRSNSHCKYQNPSFVIIMEQSVVMDRYELVSCQFRTTIPWSIFFLREILVTCNIIIFQCPSEMSTLNFIFFFVCLFRQYLPSEFWRKHLNCQTGDAILYVSSGSTWPVKICVRKCEGQSACLEKDGWKNFARDNNLELGDSCTFQLIEGNRILFKVSISRVADKLHSQR